MPSLREHWEEVYRTKPADAVSWYQSVPEPSLRALDRLAVPVTASVLDLGGGASSLVDELLRRGWRDLTVLDVSASALEVARARLGGVGEGVRWVCADVTAWRPERAWDVWHDRAVFHFLTVPEQRSAYRAALTAGTAPGSLLIMATFAPDGPERCSGLPVRRYSASDLATELGSGFALLHDWREEHRTPGGGRQWFQWCALRRI